MWQAASHSWTCCKCTYRPSSCVYPAAEVTITIPGGPHEDQEEVMLQGTLHVRPAKVLAALEWLKENNPLCRDITIIAIGRHMLLRMMLICGKHFHLNTVSYPHNNNNNNSNLQLQQTQHQKNVSTVATM